MTDSPINLDDFHDLTRRRNRQYDLYMTGAMVCVALGAALLGMLAGADLFAVCPADPIGGWLTLENASR